jgi:TetR/AcrR family transcriptional regulator, regulator of autoinduction and epiphytic fitness
MYAMADRPESETAISTFSGSTDGRSLRRERNRDSVIEALLALVREGNMDPGGAEIAERAGVSHRSVFRYFDDLGDLIRTAIETELSRGRTLGDIDDLGEGTFQHRLDALVDTRIRMFEFTHGVISLARVRAFAIPEIDEQFIEAAATAREQLVKQLQPELERVPAAERDSVVDAAQCLVSWDSYDWHKRILKHDDDAIRRAWVIGLTALLDR